jgi:hypothetical protein
MKLILLLNINNFACLKEALILSYQNNKILTATAILIQDEIGK